MCHTYTKPFTRGYGCTLPVDECKKKKFTYATCVVRRMFHLFHLCGRYTLGFVVVVVVIDME